MILEPGRHPTSLPITISKRRRPSSKASQAGWVLHCASVVWTASAAALLACSGETSKSSDTLPLTITLERAFSIGSLQDPLTPDLERTLAVTDSFLVVSAIPGIVHVFSRDGNSLREMDRRGDGPGEFAGTVIPVPEGGDRMTLLDRVTGRYLSVDLAADSILEGGTVEGPLTAVVPADEGWLATVPLGEVAGYDIVHLARSGEATSVLPPGVAADFAPDVEPGEGISPVRPAFAWVNGRVFLSPGQRYSLAAVDDEAEDGLRVIRKDPDFFDGEWKATPVAPVFRAQVRRLAPGPNGSLWVVSLIPRSDAGSEVRNIFTTWVELVDVESGEVLAQTQVPGVASMTEDGEWIYQFGEDRGLAPSVHFHRLRVEAAEGQAGG